MRMMTYDEHLQEATIPARFVPLNVSLFPHTWPWSLVTLKSVDLGNSGVIKT